jgi:type I restriction enzyme S subunit
MQNGYAFDSLEFMDSGVRILKISNIQSMRIDWEDESFIDEKYYTLLSQFRVYKNDLIFALTRPIISTGIKAAVFESDEKALLNQRNAVFRPSGKADMKWIYYIVIDSVFTHIFDMEIDKTGQQPNISTNKIGNIKIPFPPKKEQNIIIEYLDTVCNEINGLSRLIQKSVITLREYRSSLITTAVSGQIDISSERKQSNNRGSA